MVTETKLEDLKTKAADFINKSISSMTGEGAARISEEGAARISEEDRKVVNSILKIGSKIPTVGSLIGAGKTVGSILKAIEKNKNKEILERAKEGKGMKAGGEVKKKKNKVAGRLAMRGYGIARK